MTPFEKAIKRYLDKRAAGDPLFAEELKKPGKSIEECCRYIAQEVKKGASGQSCVAMKDEDVYALAVHYWDEDDIKVGKDIHAVVKNYVQEEAKKIELTPEEKEKARKLALERAITEEREKIRKEAIDRANARRKAIAEQKEREAEQSDLLFTFDD